MELTTTSIDKLRSMQSRTIGVEEFNFDQLTAPPLMSIFDISDITKLEDICTSIRYAGNPKKKKKAIQEIMQLRGFDRKYWSGTNRLAFKFPDDPRIIAKIAFDDKGRSDNPREFFNQHLIKPFVTKIFEVAGDGTVGLAERVKPIQSREEFISVADDIFSILWIITKRYIIPDTGSRYFMNWGIREGFSPVLLDFPYMYEPTSIDQLTCHAKDPLGNMCGGFIDLDEGMNELVCRKCGVKYNASEIAKILKEEEIITRERGNVKMKVGIVRGNQKIITLNTAQESTGEIKPEVSNIKPTPTNNNTETVGRKISVKINDVVREDRERKDAEARGNGRASIKRGPKGSFKPGKKTTFNPNNLRDTDNRFKVRVNRNDNKYKENKNTPPKHNNTPIAITAVSLDDLKEAKFGMSTYDAENNLVFISGKTPKGTDITLSIDANNIPWDEFDIKKEDASEEYPDLAGELEKAKTDLLSLEERKLALIAENHDLSCRVKDLENELEKLRNAIPEKDENADNTEALNKIIEVKNQTIESLEKEVEELKEVKTVPYEEFEVLENERNELTNKVNQLQSDLDAAQTDIKNMEDDKSISPKETPDFSKYEGILGLSLLSADLRYAKDMVDMDKVEDPEDFPKHVLVFPMDYEEDGKIVSDYLRDQDQNVLAVYSINDVMLDKIKFEEA